MTALWIALGVAVAAVVSLVGVWIAGLRKMADTIGLPTPEAARVQVKVATAPVEEKANADVKELQNASQDELEKSAHDWARPGGRLPK